MRRRRRRPAQQTDSETKCSATESRVNILTIPASLHVFAVQVHSIFCTHRRLLLLLLLSLWYIYFLRSWRVESCLSSLHCDLYSTNALHLTTTVLNGMEVVVVVERANFSTFFNAAAAAPQKNISPVIVGGRHRTTTRLSYRQAERDLQRSIFTQPST